MEVTEGSANSKAVVSVTRLGSPGGKRQLRGGQSLMGKRGREKRDAGCWGPKDYKGPEPLDAMPLDLQEHSSCSHNSGCGHYQVKWDIKIQLSGQFRKYSQC